MKKIISLSLAVLMIVLSFAGCSSKAPTKDELLEQAIEVEAMDINNDSFDNFVRAKEAYCNKVLKLKGTITDFGDNYVVISGYYGCEYVVDVYLPTEEMVNVENGQSVIVVGQTSEEITETSTDIGEATFEYKHFQMPTAYLVSDRIELTVVYKGENRSYAPACNVQIGDDSYLKLVYFADDVDVSKLKFNQEIKISTKAIYKNSSWDYLDATIIE